MVADFTLNVQGVDRAELLLGNWSTWMRAQSWSERTVSNRLALVRRAARLADTPADEITRDQVLTFLSQSTFSASSRRTYHASLSAWFRWLQRTRLRADDPMADVEKPHAGRRAGRHLSAAHVERLLASRMHARTRTMVLLGGYAGLRVSEIAKIRGTDVDQVSGELEVVGKGGVHAIIPLHPILQAEAERYGSGWWFPQWTSNRETSAGGHILGASVGTIVGTAMHRAGIPGSAHSLRHWHATELLRQGVDSRVIQQLMRHASLATTELYLHVDDTQRRAGLYRLPNLTAPASHAA